MSEMILEVACVAGGFVRAAGQKSWRRSRERNKAEAAGFSRGFAARCSGSAAKPFDSARTKPPTTQAILEVRMFFFFQ